MLTLFHTDGCHLCEQAWTLVEQAGMAAQTRRCDILEEEAWLEAYRVRIPVLQDSRPGAGLAFYPGGAARLAGTG